MSSKKLGPTGEFPRGKMSATDEGELRIMTGIRDKTVMIEFDTAVAWLGLDKATAIQLENKLLELAAQI